MPETLTFEQTLSTLQGLLGRRVTVYVGGAAGQPGIAAYTSGILGSAKPDEGFDELLRLHPTRGVPASGAGEVLHFRVEGNNGDPRSFFVLYELFFFQTIRLGESLIAITQREAPEPSEQVGLPAPGVAITLRIDD
jgi:hypothetical protein